MRQIFAVIVLSMSISILLFACAREEEKKVLVSKEIPKMVSRNDSLVIDASNHIKAARLKLYVENTYSMDGYFKGFTQFKEVLSQLVNEAETIDKPSITWEFYLINTVISKQNITNRITTELSKNMVRNKGARGNSEFEKEIEKILLNHEKNDISVFAADFIYSPGIGETQKRLQEFQEFTRKAFLDADLEDNNIEISLLRFNSDFNDVYYDINNDEVKNLQSRPYFLMVIAHKSLMGIMDKYIIPNLQARKDYMNKLVFNHKNSENYSLDDYTILTSTLNSMPLKALKVKNGKVKSVEIPRINEKQFAIGLDLKSIPVAEEFIFDKENYELNNYSILEIGEIKNGQIFFPESNTTKKIMGSDRNRLIGLSHVIMLTSEGDEIQNLELGIKKNIPQWVFKYSNSDDRDIATNQVKQAQTFGLEYFVSGISNAYQHQNKNLYYTSLYIPISPSAQSSGLGTILFVGLLLLLILGVIMIIKNKKQRQ